MLFRIHFYICFTFILVSCRRNINSQITNNKSNDSLSVIDKLNQGIPNTYKGKKILDYFEDQDTIFISNIIYTYQKDETALYVANVFGDKQSLFLMFFNGNLINSIQMPYIVSLDEKRISNTTLFICKHDYEDFCQRELWDELVLFNGIGFSKPLLITTSKEYYSDEPNCGKDVSYKQTYTINLLSSERLEVTINRGSKRNKKTLKI